MERNEKLRKAQWWKCKVLKSWKPFAYSGGAKEGSTGFLAIITDDNNNQIVIFWSGERYALSKQFDSIDEAKDCLTCIKKVENKTDAMISAWNDAMY